MKHVLSRCIVTEKQVLGMKVHVGGRKRMYLLNLGGTKHVSLLVLESTLDMINEKSNCVTWGERGSSGVFFTFKIF